MELPKHSSAWCSMSRGWSQWGLLRGAGECGMQLWPRVRVARPVSLTCAAGALCALLMGSQAGGLTLAGRLAIEICSLCSSRPLLTWERGLNLHCCWDQLPVCWRDRGSLSQRLFGV